MSYERVFCLKLILVDIYFYSFCSSNKIHKKKCPMIYSDFIIYHQEASIAFCVVYLYLQKHH